MITGASLLNVIREAHWLNRTRANAYARIYLAAYVVGLVAVMQRVRGAWLADGQRVTTDFAAFWTAGVLALRDGAAKAYDLGAQLDFQLAELGASKTFVPFYYPPPFLGVVLPFALAPFPLAFALFSLVGYLAYLAVGLRLLRGGAWPIAAYPAAYVNAINGQTAGLVSAVFTGACLLLERRPFVAGLVFGALVIKPQFGLLLPVAFVAAGLWRAVAGAAVSSILLGLGSLAAIGSDGFGAFIRIAAFSTQVLNNLDEIAWKMQSPYSAIRLAGGGAWFAASAQAVTTLGLALLTWMTWRGKAPVMGKCSVLAICALLATPYMFDYDLTLLIVPICWLAGEGLKRGFLPWDKAILAAAYMLSFYARPLAHATHVAVGPLVMGLLLYAVMRRISNGAPSSQATGAAPSGSPPRPA